MMMFFMWFFPLLVLALIVYLLSSERVTGLFRPVLARTCANCRHAVQSDWKACPHCGRMLS